MRTANRIRYLLAALPGFIIDLPFTVNDWFMARFFPGETKDGIRIIALNENTQKEFTDTISRVLDLIRSSDSRRFRRVTREIHVIVEVPTWSYRQPMKVQSIDPHWIKKLAEISDGYAIQFLACLLIGTAASASFRSHGILPNRRNQSRIGKICSLEMVRFARKIGMDEISFEIFGKEYEPHSFSERFKEVLEGIQYILRKQDN